MSAKISISLDERDVAYLDSEEVTDRYPSRSAAVQDAIRLLRESRLADAYAQAFAEWSDEESWSEAPAGLGAA